MSDQDVPYERGAAGASREDAAVLAFMALYDEHAGSLLHMLQTLVPPPVAEDIVHDVFLIVWNDDRFDPSLGSRRAHLRSIARHKAIDWIRRQHSAGDRDSRWAGGQNADVAIDDAVCAADDAERVRLALEALGPERRRAISLAYFGGLSYRQVANVLGVPEGTIKSRIREGLIDLRSALGYLRHVDDGR